MPEDLAAPSAINANMSTSRSSGGCRTEIGTALRISPPEDTKQTRTAVALTQLPVDPHAEPAKTLQKRLSAVKDAAAPFSTFASACEDDVDPVRSGCASGSLAD